ncbi:hypothetical protein H0A36_21415 [Endozoicomonas sp. SM1973]|uniref:Uncharacterized protein n=1 Tax=Spartinivicinus marinus TaxID=2994442 RepID=A0A853IDE9_9GAMM|nr:hypothetical protein [Spartinivicinus marinus]MCX4027099.1 hypothetical protein [Spartinivicinus marinus]NYZ68578.1 hypothetical protein [Spartinivicinus marinus]
MVIHWKNKDIDKKLILVGRSPDLLTPANRNMMIDLLLLKLFQEDTYKELEVDLQSLFDLPNSFSSYIAESFMFSGHYPHFEGPEKFIVNIKEFIER